MRVRRALADLSVFGLDLSLRGAAAVCIPRGWDFNFNKVATVRCGFGLPAAARERQHVERARDIAKEIVRFVDRESARDGQRSLFHAALEQYAFSQNTNRGSRIMELGGIVKLAWVDAGYGDPPVAIVASSARKTILGKVPKNDSKKATELQLKAMGAPAAWTDDECDAFAVANQRRLQVGLTPLGVPAER